MLKILPLTFLLLTGLCASATEEIRYIKPFEFNSPAKDYFTRLLELSLQLSEDKYGPYQMVAVEMPMLQNRQLLSLEQGKIDVLWTMTSRQREEQARAVLVPLTKGLIGYRLLLVREQDTETFKRLKSAAPLKSLTGVQGEDWPDLTIMRSNGYRVSGLNHWETIYAKLSAGSFDYFPRGLLEVGAEGAFFRRYGLEVAPEIMLYYPSAMYFFVAKGNTRLAERIEYGLNQALDSGEFDNLLLGHDSHRKAFRELNPAARRIFTLDNPLLPDTARTLDSRLWLSPEQFKSKLEMRAY